MFTYKVLCSAGVLVQGSVPDFLLCIAAARDAASVWAPRLFRSTLRLQIFYPNRKRVPASDVNAALRALENVGIAGAVARRRAVAAQIPPARSEARTAGICAAIGRGEVVVVGSDFCQAGVVAPPDSPDLGKPVLCSSVALGA